MFNLFISYFVVLLFSFGSLYSKSFEEKMLQEDFICEETFEHLMQIKERYPTEYSAVIDTLSTLRDHFFESQVLEKERPGADAKIPRIVHFIWLGPDVIPDVGVFHRWHEKNPDYKLILWSDRVRTILLPFVEIRNIFEIFPLTLQEEFYATENYAEKADILRLEILERFGGIYSDMDINCHLSFEPLTQNYEFFCGMELVSPFTNNNFVRVGNALIGATPHHELITKTIDLTKKRWSEITTLFEDYLLRMTMKENTSFSRQLIFCRTFLSFTDVVLGAQLKPTEAVFPHYYFGLVTEHSYKYCRHLAAGSWFPKKQFFEGEEFNKRIKKLFKNLNHTMAISSLSLFFSSSALILLLIRGRRRKKC